MALMLTLVGMSLSGLLVPIVVQQIDAARDNIQRNDALDAAQAGIDAVLGRIRAAVDDSGVGVLSGLPCFPAGTPLTGTVSSASTATYQVKIAYSETDPLIAPKWITCSPITGPTLTPTFALISSTGTVKVGGVTATRTLDASYVFQKTNANIAGGLVHIYKTATSNDLCLDAGTATPGVGSPVRMQPCSPGSSEQQFAYKANLTLQLTASVTASAPFGMCLDAGQPHKSGLILAFQPCGKVTKPQQQWSLNDSANFEGTGDGKNLDGHCLNVDEPDQLGSLVLLANGGNCHHGYDNIETWSPDAAVGAGAASALTTQLVNFSQFGRCIDVTEKNVNYAYLIVWPCKQAPDVANVAWNQKWALPAIGTGHTSATGRITTKPNSLYCMQSPGSTDPGEWVKVVPCPAGSPPTNLTWTVYGDTHNYLDSYRVVDGYGNCLVPSDLSDLYPKGYQISKLVVQDCSGDTTQKWNAPPNILQPLPLKDIGEK
jgi:hypothetical protein